MSSLIRFYYPSTEFDGLVSDLINGRSNGHCQRTSTQLDAYHPKLDLHESKDANVVTATFELPGLRPEDVIISIERNRLTVSGETATSNSHEEGGYSVRERRNGKFSRTLQLPFGIKPEDVQAKMVDGILTVTFPKETPEQQPQRISIQ